MGDTQVRRTICASTESAGKRESYHLFAKRVPTAATVQLPRPLFAWKCPLRTNSSFAPKSSWTLAHLHSDPGIGHLDLRRRRPHRRYVTQDPLALDSARLQVDKEISRRPREEVGIADGICRWRHLTRLEHTRQQPPETAQGGCGQLELGVGRHGGYHSSQSASQRLFRLHQGGRAVFWSDAWGDSESAWRLYLDVDAQPTNESSQNFDTMDFLSGVDTHASIGNPLTDCWAPPCWAASIPRPF